MSYLGTISRRLSHVGRRPTYFEAEKVTISFKSKPNAVSKAFQQTPVVQKIVATGPLGTLSFPLHKGLTCELQPGHAETERKIVIGLDQEVFDRMSKYKQKFVRSMWGTTATGVNRIVEGVTEVSLRLVGVGYKAAVDTQANSLVLKLGYSHDVVIPIPENITAKCASPISILLYGIDYQKTTQFAAKIRAYRPPEPYNGKGVFVGDETIILKEEKKK